ncbi:MAG: hypothetical protein GY906_07780 [bacterium]|nr:hypothetical protein [bacterium]
MAPTIERKKTCSCGQDIGFVRTQRGSAAPVDVPAAKAYVWNEAGSYWEILPVYVAHHTTCPHVDRYKKEKRNG